MITTSSGPSGISAKTGRRPLMLVGAAGLAVIHTAIGYCYHLKGGGSAVPNTLLEETK